MNEKDITTQNSSIESSKPTNEASAINPNERYQSAPNPEKKQSKSSTFFSKLADGLGKSATSFATIIFNDTVVDFVKTIYNLAKTILVLPTLMFRNSSRKTGYVDLYSSEKGADSDKNNEIDSAHKNSKTVNSESSLIDMDALKGDALHTGVANISHRGYQKKQSKAKVQKKEYSVSDISKKAFERSK